MDTVEVVVCCCFVFSWFIISFNMLSIFVDANSFWRFCLQQRKYPSTWIDRATYQKPWDCGTSILNRELSDLVQENSMSVQFVTNAQRHTVIGTFARGAANDYWGRLVKRTDRLWRDMNWSLGVFLTQIRLRVIHCPCVDAVHHSLEITFCSYFTRGGERHNLWPIDPSHSWW